MTRQQLGWFGLTLQDFPDEMPEKGLLHRQPIDSLAKCTVALCIV